MVKQSKKKHRDSVPQERITGAIILLRGQKVLLDADLAGLYGVETSALTRAVRRNIERFPDDFMFQLTKEEFTDLKSHFGISSQWGGRRYRPYAFTEQGVAMLSSVLRSERAVSVNIEIMRAFVRVDGEFVFLRRTATTTPRSADTSLVIRLSLNFHT
jgi:hypothetical protein